MKKPMDITEAAREMGRARTDKKKAAVRKNLAARRKKK